jgi:hypothetical protein
MSVDRDKTYLKLYVVCRVELKGRGIRDAVTARRQLQILFEGTRSHGHAQREERREGQHH